MSQSDKQIYDPKNYKYHIDTRTNMEKLLSDKLVHILTQNNLKRVTTHKTTPNDYILKNEYFFLCIAGVPLLPNDYDILDLPGQRYVYAMTGLQGKFTKEEYREIFNKATLEVQADNVAKIVQKIPTNKKIIIICHSFGGYIYAAYIHKYGTSRVFGLIQAGANLLTMHPISFKFVKSIPPGFDEKMIFDDTENFQKKYFFPAIGGSYAPTKNNIHYAIWQKLVMGEIFKKHYQWLRNESPKVLKLIIYGRTDTLLPQTLQNEKSIYFSYIDKLDSAYDQNLKTAYERLYKTKVNNVQQKFIFNFEQGKHSVHMQKKFVPQINMAIRQYLQILDLASNLQYAKI